MFYIFCSLRGASARAYWDHMLLEGFRLRKKDWPLNPWLVWFHYDLITANAELDDTKFIRWYNMYEMIQQC